MMYKNIEKLIIIPYYTCNFKCQYCFEANKTSDIINISDVISLGKQIINDTHQLHIHYIGGEPLINFKMMDEIVSYLSFYARKTKSPFSIFIDTNGSIMNENIIKHFKAYHYIVSISCDGIKQAHNSYRQDFDIVNKNIDMLIKYNIYPIIHIVVTDKNVKYLYDSVDFFAKKGIKTIGFSYTRNNDKYKFSLKEYDYQLSLIINYVNQYDIKLDPPFERGYIIDDDTRCTGNQNMYDVCISPNGITTIHSLDKWKYFTTLCNDINITPFDEHYEQKLINIELKYKKLYHKK